MECLPNQTPDVLEDICNVLQAWEGNLGVVHVYGHKVCTFMTNAGNTAGVRGLLEHRTLPSSGARHAQAAGRASEVGQVWGLWFVEACSGPCV